MARGWRVLRAIIGVFDREGLHQLLLWEHGKCCLCLQSDRPDRRVPAGARRPEYSRDLPEKIRRLQKLNTTAFNPLVQSSRSHLYQTLSSTFRFLTPPAPPLPGRCPPFTRSWWGSSASASCGSTTPSTKTQSGESRTGCF